MGKPVTASSNIGRDGANDARGGRRRRLGYPLVVGILRPAMDRRRPGQPSDLPRRARLGGRLRQSLRLEVSLDGKTWKEVYGTENRQGRAETIRFAPTDARWVRMRGTRRATSFGYSLWEIRVFTD